MEKIYKVNIVIPTYNRKHLLKRCLELLFEQTYPKDDYEIIVIDDGSTDGTGELVRILSEISPVSLKYISQKNRGPSSARNTGIRNARGEIIAFTDDDCIPDKNWLKNIIAPFSDKTIGGVEGRVEKIGERTPFTRVVENLEGGSSYITANIAYRKEILERVNMLNEKLPYAVLEDIDLAYRVLESGNIIIFSKEAVVAHEVEEKTVKSSIKKLKYLKNFLFLKDQNPRLYRDVYKSFLFVIFLRPFSLKNWRYLIRNPVKIPDYLIIYIAESLYALYLILFIHIRDLKKLPSIMFS